MKNIFYILIISILSTCSTYTQNSMDVQINTLIDLSTVIDSIGNDIDLQFYSFTSFVADKNTDTEDLSEEAYRDTLKSLLKLKPDFVDKYLRSFYEILGKQKEGNASKIEKKLRKLLNEKPETDVIYFLLASIVKKQNSSEYLELLNKSIELNPYIIPYYKIRASYFKKQKQWTLAIQDYKHCIQQNPEDTSMYMLLSFLYQFELKDLEKAIQYRTQAIQILEQKEKTTPKKDEEFIIEGNAMPNSNYLTIQNELRMYYESRGHLYLEIQDLEKAKQDWQKAMKLGSEEAERLLEQYKD